MKSILNLLQVNKKTVKLLRDNIYKFLLIDNVARTLSALKVSGTAKSVKIKLTKKLSLPCLTFEIDLVKHSNYLASLSILIAYSHFQPSGSNHSRLVVHDIPVNLVPRRLWNDYAEPGVVDPDVILLDILF